MAILVWAATPERADALAASLAGEGRIVTVMADEGELAQAAWRGGAHLLVAEDGPGLASQEAFLRVPLILVQRAGVPASPRLARRAYAIVARSADLELAVDRFMEHRLLAERAALRREPPRRCSRCGRGYDSSAGRKGVAMRFVRFGVISVCGGCIETLRQLLVKSDTPFVEAEMEPTRA